MGQICADGVAVEGRIAEAEAGGLHKIFSRARNADLAPAHYRIFWPCAKRRLAPGDHERFYTEGRIREDARAIWEALAAHGPMATLELRHACRMETKAGNKRFKRAILDLQCLLAVVHSGTEQETSAWASGRYELACRAFPKQAAAAQKIAPAEARAALTAKYLEWYPNAPVMQLSRLFGWTKEEASAAMRADGSS